MVSATRKGESADEAADGDETADETADETTDGSHNPPQSKTHTSPNRAAIAIGESEELLCIHFRRLGPNHNS